MSNYGSAFLAYFYFDFKDTAKQDLRALLSSILIQFSNQSDMFCDPLFSLYSTHKRGLEQPTDDSLARCLKDMLTTMEEAPIYLVIDALDECPNDFGIPSPREKVLELVKELVDIRHPSLRLCITSRPEFDIRTALEPLATHQLCHHDASGQKQDIVDYITFVVRSDKTMKRWRDDEKNMVIEKLTEKADGMYGHAQLFTRISLTCISNRFRWVFCQLEVLRHTFPINLRRVLDELPKSLDETYKRILKEINNVNRLHAYHLLQCLMVAGRPLLVEELAEILALDLSTEGIPKLNADWRWEHQEEAVLSACSSLVSIIIEDGSRIVQFSHFSVKEFLTSDRLASCMEDVSWFHIPIEPSHVILAHACFSVLLCLDDRADKESVKTIPLYRYAAKYWVRHARVESVELQIKDVMDCFFDMDKPHFSAWIRIQGLQDLFKVQVSLDGEPNVVPPLSAAAPLYLAAWRGFRGLVERLIVNHSEQLNQFGGRYGTALHASVHGGHINVAKLLCAHGADIHSCCPDNWTPLHIASQEGHLEIGKWLLGQGADVNSRTKKGSTPLMLSARYGHLEVCSILLECNANTNAQDDIGFTPLLNASRNGHQDVVRLLLNHNADVHVCNSHGNTPLFGAANGGNLEVTRTLLEQNAKVNSRNNLGRTPLFLASQNGHRDVVQLLLDHKGDVHARDNDGYTSLSLAAYGGHLEIVQILLECDVDLNSMDNLGRTPLILASAKGHQDVVQLLLYHHADVHVRGNNGDITLSWASYGGHLEVARILLEHNVDVNSRDEHRFTPLLYASQIGHRDLVQLLLDHGADAHVRSIDGDTPSILLTPAIPDFTVF